MFQRILMFVSIQVKFYYTRFVLPGVSRVFAPGHAATKFVVSAALETSQWPHCACIFQLDPPIDAEHEASPLF